MPELDRECGSCYACCVYLGINELKKWPAQSCKNLTGANGPEKRCGIYSQRPKACVKYHCAWISGLGDENMRPDKSGILVTPYPPNFPDSGTMSATVTIISKPELEIGDLQDGPLRQIINQLAVIGCRDIRILSYETKNIIHIFKGQIFKGKRLKSKTYEELIVQTFNPPVGEFRVFDTDEEAQEFLQKGPQNDR